MSDNKKVNLLGNSSGEAEEVPYDIVKLPSKGLVYSEDHPLHMEQDVSFRAPGAPEENILASMALLKKGTVIDTLLRSCLTNKSIDPSDLLIGDKSAITLMIRIAGFGPEYKVKTKCPSCGKDFPHEFNLAGCQYKFLETQPVEPGKNLFSFVLPSCKRKVLFSLLTAKEDASIMKTQENRKKHTAGDGVDTIITDRFKTQIHEVEGIRKEEIPKFIDNSKMFNMRDSRALRTYINKISPDMVMEETVECSFCGAEEVHTIPIGMEFFWPKME